jgi:hypothetical protein
VNVIVAIVKAKLCSLGRVMAETTACYQAVCRVSMSADSPNKKSRKDLYERFITLDFPHFKTD